MWGCKYDSRMEIVMDLNIHNEDNGMLTNGRYISTYQKVQPMKNEKL